MAEYIKREATCKDCFHYCVCKDTVADENWKETAPKEIREMFSPSGCKNYVLVTNVAEVRHGKWVMRSNGYMCRPQCSVCGGAAVSACAGTLYCPHCGAKMDEKE